MIYKCASYEDSRLDFSILFSFFIVYFYPYCEKSTKKNAYNKRDNCRSKYPLKYYNHPNVFFYRVCLRNSPITIFLTYFYLVYCSELIYFMKYCTIKSSYNPICKHRFLWGTIIAMNWGIESLSEFYG